MSPAAAPSEPNPPAKRLISLDAYRGAIMLLMASSGLGIPQIAAKFPNNPLWQFLAHQCEHVEWTGCVLWDLIQPAFMFMVGVALPWSVAARVSKGAGFGVLFAQALWRSVLLVLLGVFLTSAWSRQTEWEFPNVLCQIGWGYPFLFLIYWASFRIQVCIVAGILGAYGLFFALSSLPPSSFDWTSVGVPESWTHLQGFAAHWEKNFNAAARFDQWFLNLFPREVPFTFNKGGYQTLNFVPSIATMVFGIWAGRLLRSEGSREMKLRRLCIAGVLGLVLGFAVAGVGLCPIVKRIWTPSWVLFSGGWAVLLLAGFVALVDRGSTPKWAAPLVIAGLNPIALYCLWQLTGGFFRDTLRTHFGRTVFETLGSTWTPMLERGSVLLIFWLILFWMHRRKIYIRL